MASAKTHPYVPTQAQIPDNDLVVAHANPTYSNNYTMEQAASTPQGEAKVLKPKYVDIQSRNPVVLTHCPHCGVEQVGTRTRTQSTGATWACCGAGFILFWPLCWLPFAIKEAKQTNHYCMSCNQKVGRVKAFT
jgi:predicted RNA-binding Zn-ribbon protein involved in translation (DUF1610 family)